MRLSQLYLSLTIGKAAPGFGTHLSAATTFLLSNGWGGSLRYGATVFRSPAIPSDYNPAGFFGPSYPQDQVNIFSVLLLRQWHAGNPLIHYGISAGPADVIYNRSTFVPNPHAAWFTNSYAEHVNSEAVPGLSARGYVQFPVGRAFGLEAGVFGNINTAQSTLAIEACLDFGHMRKRLR